MQACLLNTKVKYAILTEESRRGAYLPSSVKTLKSVTHGQGERHQTYSYFASRLEHHCLLSDAKIYCLVKEARA